MIRDGRFVNLQWDKLRIEHQQYWNILQRRYHLCCSQLTEPDSLDNLAQQCIHLCRNHLFAFRLQKWAVPNGVPIDLTPWDIFRQPLEGMFYEDNLAAHLTQALCDHLIVTFAYRFYCENLEPLDEKGWLKKLSSYHCTFRQDGVNKVEDNTERNEKTHNFINSKQKTCAAFKDSVKKMTEQINATLKKVKESDPDFEEYSLMECIYIDSEQILKNCFLPPNWLFSLFLAFNWKNNPYKSFKDNQMRLLEFISKNELSPLLLKKQSQHKFDEIYVGIGYQPESIYIDRLPAQNYLFKGTQNRIEISETLQYVFNNYLMERNFHGFAIAVALDALRWEHQITIDKASLYPRVLQIVRLQAPLVHAKFVKLLIQVYKYNQSSDCLLWINDYINYWNSTALPILEELFLWGLSSFYSFSSIPDEIEKSMTKSEYGPPRSERMNFYHLIPTDNAPNYKKRVGYSKDFGENIDQFFNMAYSSALGMEITSCYSSTECIKHYNPGLCTAFD